MKMNGAIFDIDGTLLDSMYIWDTIGEEYLRSLGVTPRESLNEKFKNMSLYQAACYYRSDYGVLLSTDEIMDGVNTMIEQYYKAKVSLKKGAADFLALLDNRGVRMCIATATDRHLIEAALLRLHIRRYFLDIFTCTSVGHGKDEPDIYEAALSLLGTQKTETVVFEDALYAINTAKAAGFTVAAIYDRYENQPEAVRAASDYYADDFDQFREVMFQ